MRQLIRINVAGQGYSLYSVNAQGMRREPLDAASETVPREYLAAQRRLDEYFAMSDGPWSMTFRSSERGCVLAYGCKIGGADQMGRLGLILIHGIVLENPHELPDCALGVLTLLSPTRVRRLTQSIEEVAQGSLPVQKLLDWLVRETDLRAQSSQGLPAASKADRRVGEIAHDCAGAAAFAWLFFARQQATARGPWEAYDTLRDDGEPITRLVPSEGLATTASRLLAQMLKTNETERPRSLFEEPVQSLPTRPKRPSPESPEVVPTTLYQEPAIDPLEQSEERAGSKPERHGFAKQLVLAFILFLGISWAAWRALSPARDLKPMAQEAIRRITDEAEQSVSSIAEARSQALERIERRTESLLEQLDASTRVMVSSDPPDRERCDGEEEQGRLVIHQADGQALLYVCSRERGGWLEIGQRQKVTLAARKPKAAKPRPSQRQEPEGEQR